MQAEAPEEYKFLIHKEVVSDENTTLENTKKQVLYWIGFRVTSS